MRIFFVRHGQSTFYLSDCGQEQMLATADFLKGLNLDTTQVRLLTSPQVRAVSSAKIIQEVLTLQEPLAVGWLSDGAGGYDIPKTITEFSTQNPTCQVIIAVSHMPEVEEALEKFAKILGQSFYANARNGSVHLIDTDTKEVKKLFEP